MRSKDIVLGEYYKFKEHPNYSYAKAIKIYKAKEYDKKINHIIVKCEHVVYKNDKFGFIRYFKPSELIK